MVDSTTTSSIEDILVQVQKKLSLKPTESPAVRTPLSWRKKLAGFVAEPTQTQPQDNSAASSTTQSTLGPDDSNTNTSFVIPGPKTKDWKGPGAYGINQDEGTDAPDLNSPDLTSVCEMWVSKEPESDKTQLTCMRRQIGRQKISLICGWEEPHSTNAALRPIRAHILFKGPLQGDLYFLQLQEGERASPICVTGLTSTS